MSIDKGVSLPSKYFEDVVTEVVKELGYEDHITKIESGTTRGLNYLGDIYRVKVEGENGGRNKKFNLILKLLPDSREQREKMQMENFSDREAFVYREVIPAFDKLQDGCGPAQRFNHVKMYRVLSEKFKEMLVMNDLSIEGYRTSVTGRNLDLEHSMVVMKELGKLHALSFALKHYSPEKFNTFTSLDEVLLSHRNIYMKRIIEDHVRHGFESVNDPAVISKLKSLHEGSYERTMELLKYESAEPHAVLCHGDAWTNNFLFKYTDGELQSVMMLDWQLARFCSPASDIYLFIFTSVDNCVRACNFQDLLQAYYLSLSEFLRELRCDPEALFSEQDYRHQLKKFSFLGLIINLVQMPVFTAKHEDIHLDSVDFNNPNIKALFGPQIASQDYIDRITGMVKDLINNDLL